MVRLFILFSFLSMGLHAQKFKPQHVIFPKDSEYENYFGCVIGVDQEGKQIAVGAPKENRNNSGAVYIFTMPRFRETQKIKSPGKKKNSLFGKSLQFNQRNLIVGAPCDGETQKKGAAFIYSFSEDQERWNLLTSLESSVSGKGDQFGQCVQLKDDLAIVSAPGSSEGGVVFIFKQSETEERKWLEVEKIKAPNSAIGFGSSMAYNGKFLIVGAPFANHSQGAFYIYEKQNQKTAFQLLQVVEGKNDSLFAHTVRLNDQVVAVSSRKNKTGVVHLYRKKAKKNQWEKVQLLKPDFRTNTYGFGESIYLNQNFIFIGTPLYNNNRGGYYAYRKKDDKWERIFRPEGNYCPDFGSYAGADIKLYNNQILLLGAPGKNREGKIVEIQTNLSDN